MTKLYNKQIQTNSRELRKNMTKEERRLWYDFLKGLSVNVKRQKIFEKYIVDFYCDSAKLVIELDGSQHFEEEEIQKDCVRDMYFQKLGIKVLRYSNYDIWNHFDAVCSDIYNHIFERK